MPPASHPHPPRPCGTARPPGPLRRSSPAPERLREPEQGPAVLGESLEVFAIGLLGLGILPRLQQRGAERVPDRVVPLGRLEVEARVLDLGRLPEVGDARVEVAAAGRDLAGQGVHRDGERASSTSASSGVAALIAVTVSSAACASAHCCLAAWATPRA